MLLNAYAVDDIVVNGGLSGSFGAFSAASADATATVSGQVAIGAIQTNTQANVAGTMAGVILTGGACTFTQGHETQEIAGTPIVGGTMVASQDNQTFFASFFNSLIRHAGIQAALARHDTPSTVTPHTGSSAIQVH